VSLLAAEDDPRVVERRDTAGNPIDGLEEPAVVESERVDIVVLRPRNHGAAGDGDP
jgi:hypothetical protein